MLKELKRKSFKHSLVWTVACMFIGAVMAYAWSPYAIGFVNGFTPFESLAPDDFKKQVVEIDLASNFGYCLEERTIYLFRLIPIRGRVKQFYYIIRTGNADGAEAYSAPDPRTWDNDGQYILIKVPKKYRDRMDEMTENTYQEIPSEPIHFIGGIHRLSNNDYDKVKDFFIASGWAEEDLGQMMLPYYIDASESLFSRLLAFSFSIVLLLYVVYRLIRGATGGYTKKIRKTFQDLGYYESSIESDLRSASACDEARSVRIGELFTYYDLNATVPMAAPNNKIIWAYDKASASEKPNAPHNVILFLENSSDSIELYVRSETVAQEILNQLRDRFPWIVVEYSDELKKLFQEDRAQFLQLKYLRYHAAAAFNGADDADR
ncbi:MAG: hypothetical protein NC432_02360 [Roseburia sp.]|nr:hypothetical protein [Roseburia sp.]MCM1097465.1 hypothetical protein [Ruminococcus flavefaciens]